jgi:hypothetical protein
MLRGTGVTWKYEPGEEADEKKGKHSHILSCMMELKAERGVELSAGECILFDDDEKNIVVRPASGLLRPRRLCVCVCVCVCVLFCVEGCV